MATVVEERTSTLNSLLRGEISAIETYEQALPKFTEAHGATQLRRIASEHRDAVQTLRTLVQREGADTSDSSGPWGYWATMITGMAKLLGDSTTLSALYQGEDHGMNAYKNALENVSVPLDAKEIITMKLLPQQYEHLATLNQLRQQM